MEQNGPFFKTKLEDVLTKMINNRIMTDTEIKLEGKTFNCHNIVLRLYSQFFVNQADMRFFELPPEKISHLGFGLAYEWMLNEEFPEDPMHLLELYKAAEFLEMPVLISHLWTHWGDVTLYNEDTACVLFLLARKHQLKALANVMLQNIKRFFIIFVSSKDFFELSVDELVQLLRSSHIAVHTEADVFMSGVRWMLADWHHRQHDLVAVMNCVRFGLMNTATVATLCKKPELVLPRVVANFKSMRDVASKALRENSLTLPECEWLKNLVEQPDLRQRAALQATNLSAEWIECSENEKVPSYDSFSKYLETISGTAKDYWEEIKEPPTSQPAVE